MAKIQKSVRLSKVAVEQLTKMKEMLEVSEAEILQQALANFYEGKYRRLIQVIGQPD